MLPGPTPTSLSATLRRLSWLLPIAALLADAAHAQAYRCEVDGKVVYQQQRCEGGTRLKSAPGPRPESREFLVARAIGLREVIVGMTEQEVLRSIGRPAQLRSHPTNRGTIEIWTYTGTSGGGFRREVELRNGVVSAVR